MKLSFYQGHHRRRLLMFDPLLQLSTLPLTLPPTVAKLLSSRSMILTKKVKMSRNLRYKPPFHQSLFAPVAGLLGSDQNFQWDWLLIRLVNVPRWGIKCPRDNFVAIIVVDQ